MADTNAGTVEFELVSPAKLLVSKPVEMVVIPGAEGDIGVLPGHSQSDGQSQAVTGGYACYGILALRVYLLVVLIFEL